MGPYVNNPISDNPPHNPATNHIPAEYPETSYEPSIAPDPPNNDNTPPISEQPEQEASPPPSNHTDPEETNTETFGTDIEELQDDNPDDDALLPQMTALPELALNAVEEGTERASPLFAFETFKEAGELSQVCLAEDGLPYFHEPLECNNEECFVLEVPMKSSDIHAWNCEANPEQMCQVAAASQRARAEVQIKTLTPEEKKLFEVAKDNELSCWLSTNSLKPILRQKLNPDQILRSRWALTSKDGESVDGKPA